MISEPLTGLTTGTTYYYTAKAVNPQGTVWGPVKTFVPANTALNKFSIADLALWLDATDVDGDGTVDSLVNGNAVQHGLISRWAINQLPRMIPPHSP